VTLASEFAFMGWLIVWGEGKAAPALHPAAEG
jgi:hypothetical protein